MIEWTNQAWDESYIREILNGDTGYISYLQEFFRQSWKKKMQPESKPD